MKELENTMEKSIDRNGKSIESLKNVNEMTNRVAEAIYSLRQ
jgi:hypothetical protein